MKTIYSIFNLKLYCFFLLSTYLMSVNAQEQLTNLPTFYIDTENGAPILSKENYVKGTLTVKSLEEGEVLTSVKTEIRGRGNSTWGMAKKPYRLKLDKKTNLLGLPAKEKNWVLLANYADKTLMRNAVAFKISELVGLEFTPSARFVDVVLNGEFLGNYMVSDQIQVAGEHRVPVEEQELTATELPDISGGYLLEIDGFAASELVWFTTPKALKVTVKYPKDDEINPAQLNYIKKYITDFENVLFSANYADPENGYRKWVDVETLINWYIACELTGNSDSFWSTYIYKKYQDDKIYFGPMWDYDIAFNNDNRLGDATQKLMRNYAHNPRTWVERMWTDEWFRDAVNTRWKELLENGMENSLLQYIDETAALLESSQQKNFQRWNILDRRVYMEQFLFPTYGKGVEYLKTYLGARIDFLTTSFQNSAPEKPSETFVADEYYYYSIMNKKTNNFIGVSNSSTQADAPLALYLPDSNGETDDYQLWSVIPLEGDLFRIVNKNSGMAMTSKGHGNVLVQSPVNNSNANQQWQIVPVLSGNIYALVNPVSGHSLNNEAGRFDDGNPLIEWTNDIFNASKENQHWYFQKMEEIDPTSIHDNIRQTDVNIKLEGRMLYISNLEKGSSVRIFTVQGYSIASLNNVGDEITLELPSSGIYIIQLVSDGIIHHCKFMVR